MAKADLLSILYSKEKSPLEFKFDSMWIPSMYNFITPQDVAELHYLASSAKYSSKIDFKYKEIDRIMRNRGFRKFHCGTNRIVYSYLEDQSFLIKIALDKVGLSDNPAEYKNQFLLKPFVTKVFEVSPCGTVATVERVEPITSRAEFISVAEDIFDLMNECIIGQYVLEDVGTNYFMNWGLRKGFGAVLLDYTYVYELDGNKLFCNKVIPQTGEICNGVIDYDDGFNNLICSKCGKRYQAKELEQSVKDKLIILKEEGEIEMKISLKRGNETVATYYTNNETESVVRRTKKNFNEDKALEVSLSRNSNTIADQGFGMYPDQFNGWETEQEPQLKVSLRGGRFGNNRNQRPQQEKKQEYTKVRVNLNTNTNRVQEEEIKKPEPTTVEEKVVVKEEPKVIKEEVKATPVYTRDIPVDKVENNFLKDEEIKEEKVDMLSKLGLSDEDFEEPKEETKQPVQQSFSLENEDKEDPMSKYYEEFDEEQESFQRIKKGNKKSVMDNY